MPGYKLKIFLNYKGENNHIFVFMCDGEMSSPLSKQSKFENLGELNIHLKN